MKSVDDRWDETTADLSEITNLVCPLKRSVLLSFSSSILCMLLSQARIELSVHQAADQKSTDKLGAAAPISIHQPIEVDPSNLFDSK